MAVMNRNSIMTSSNMKLFIVTSVWITSFVSASPTIWLATVKGDSPNCYCRFIAYDFIYLIISSQLFFTTSTISCTLAVFSIIKNINISCRIQYKIFNLNSNVDNFYLKRILTYFDKLHPYTLECIFS